ncbi:DUF982 domain-containing protein [Phyllobacterium endophyticum]|uniref:DUF982 domain-containing protein n=1 Tax=Phyllobacterium endophyticum TaxID=1149773 RepID=A0A2P7AVI0_9HYPH|nr:DUF982 domain-containing protein [Phyllobacterium endophyticum]MBB3234778.1 hypothetical protein [Phyllobacterium endophyticum]PSH58222.1 DUF982 domain-containing protein [Phyllobacterium endophyticum]TYR38900.1 DUF982 domain-containing protein [Phyllobacterium endophyticum]
MTKRVFQHVNVDTANAGRILTVASVEDALEFMRRHWPRDKAGKFNAAERACLEALDGRQSVEAARRAFVAATQEAGLYIKERTP